MDSFAKIFAGKMAQYITKTPEKSVLRRLLRCYGSVQPGENGRVSGGICLAWRGNLYLLLTAFIWGTAFVAQAVGMERLGPFTYMAARFFLGGVALALFLYMGNEKRRQEKRAGIHFSGWRSGVLAGLIMFIAAALQQVGMQYTTVGKASFLTCLYLIFVPLAGVFLHQPLRFEHGAGAVLALGGLYFLCLKDSFALDYGDGIILVGAFFWTFHILFIDRFAAHVDIIEMSLAQVIMTFILSLAAALGLENWIWSDVIDGWQAIAYAGILSTGVAFTLQIAGQKYAAPASAAILMSLEAVFGALGGWVVLGQALTLREIFGCALMVAGMLIIQLYGFLFRRSAS